MQHDGVLYGGHFGPLFQKPSLKDSLKSGKKLKKEKKKVTSEHTLLTIRRSNCKTRQCGSNMDQDCVTASPVSRLECFQKHFSVQLTDAKVCDAAAMLETETGRTSRDSRAPTCTLTRRKNREVQITTQAEGVWHHSLLRTTSLHDIFKCFFVVQNHIYLTFQLFLLDPLWLNNEREKICPFLSLPIYFYCRSITSALQST